MHQQLTQALIQTRLDDLDRLSRLPRPRPARSVRLGTRSALSAARRTLFTPVATRLSPAR